MARVRTGGAGAGYAWALVIFGAGFVISLLLAIVFWTQVGGARSVAEEAQQDLAQFANANQRNNPELTARAGGGRTVVGALMEENQTLKEMIAGDSELTVEAIAEQKENLGIELSFARGVQALLADIQSLQREIEEARQQIEVQTSRADAAVEARESLSQEYQQSVQQLEQQISQLNQDLAAYRGAGEQLETSVTGQIEQLRREKDNRIAQLQVEVGQMTSERDRLRDLLNSITRVDLDEGSKITRPDGEITSVSADDGRVFINRGQNDRILLGMTFEIFDRGQLVELGEGDISQTQLRGKATVEVIDVRESTSLARIVRTQAGRGVSVGDQLVNLVYDPQASYKFFVYGDFDIERTGQPQVSDRRRVENMITRWGGSLADALSYDVDFLILGAEPPLPEALPPGVIDPVRIAQNVEAQRNYETYQQLVGQAREMGIPILNQNRFLSLVGYYQR